ncbi:hypothetical protein EIP86_000809 [Pleurotus ostreatoroseus]|nr:hypothetical protein EIP86_000809 [Pleurotus ostreatoroseus]
MDMSMDMSGMTMTTSASGMSTTTSAAMTMATTSTSDMGMSMDMMMIPYLHFTGGDNLFFKTLTPSSHGAIAGACIVLGFLAILERWIAGVRGVLDNHWTYRAQGPVKPKVSEKDFEASKDDVESIKELPVVKGNVYRKGRLTRLSPPFVLSHDIPRGLVFAFQAFLAYVLMLAVM